MSILSEITNLIKNINIPVETGYFSEKPPDTYIVLIPLTDTFEMYADDEPQSEIQEVRVSIFTKNNYISLKDQLSNEILEAGFIISDRRYIGFEFDTKYHHYVIEIMREYNMNGGIGIVNYRT